MANTRPFTLDEALLMMPCSCVGTSIFARVTAAESEHDGRLRPPRRAAIETNAHLGADGADVICLTKPWIVCFVPAINDMTLAELSALRHRDWVSPAASCRSWRTFPDVPQHRT